MLSKRILLFAVIIGFAYSCTTGTKVSTVRQNADQAYEAKDYVNALAAYEQIIASYKLEQKTDECPVYGRAGLAALNTGDVPKATDYLKMDTYTPFATGETYRGLAECYRKNDNLSKEILTLQKYLELFPEGEDLQDVNIRLFETYVESENWELAQELWPDLPDSEMNEDILVKWFTVNLALDNDGKCNVLSIRLLKSNPNNIPALEWQAGQAFRKAENHYQTEMDAYEKSKTNKQYKRLLEELKVVTTEFQEAKRQYEKLYSLDPKPVYAQYLSNIYVRLNDQKKADYYREKAGM